MSATGTAPVSSIWFGPRVPEVRVTPPCGVPGSDVSRRKPYTGMTIRLTPEILAQLRKTGAKPSIELILNNEGKGGPVLVVGGEEHNTNAHKMAVGSEVHLIAKTQTEATTAEAISASRHEAGSGGVNERGGGSSGKGPAVPGISIFASLHRKLIVRQVLTEAKRGKIRARKGEIDRLEKDAKKTMVRMEDKDEMLAAAGSIPVPAGPTPTPGVERDDRKKRSRSPGTEGEDRTWAGAGDRVDGDERDTWRVKDRDPLSAWVSECYNHDDYAGHVTDLRHFLRGIDFHHVMFRYHVKPDGTLDADRRRFCIKFKTRGGRDLALGRSGEALGASWSGSPSSVTVLRSRNEKCSEKQEKSLGELLMVLPQGSSVAEVLQKVKTRLPSDLSSATAQSSDGHTERSSRNGRRRPQQDLQTYLRDLLRASLGAVVIEAGTLGVERGAPHASVVGSDDDNARRVARLAAEVASAELDAERGLSLAAASTVEGREDAARSKRLRGSKMRLSMPSGPKGGARAQRRATAKLADTQAAQR